MTSISMIIFAMKWREVQTGRCATFSMNSTCTFVLRNPFSMVRISPMDKLASRDSKIPDFVTNPRFSKWISNSNQWLAIQDSLFSTTNPEILNLWTQIYPKCGIRNVARKFKIWKIFRSEIWKLLVSMLSMDAAQKFKVFLSSQIARNSSLSSVSAK